MQRRFTSVEEVTAHVALVFFLRALAFCETVSSAYGIGADAVQAYLRLVRTRLVVAFLHPARALVVCEAPKVATTRCESALVPGTANVIGTSVATGLWVTTRT